MIMISLMSLWRVQGIGSKFYLIMERKDVKNVWLILCTILFDSSSCDIKNFKITKNFVKHFCWLIPQVNFSMDKNSHQRCSIKKVFLKISQNFIFSSTSKNAHIHFHPSVHAKLGNINYFLLWKVHRFINKVINVTSCVSYFLIFSVPHKTFSKR